MASPSVEGRSINPREKGHFTLQLSDRIVNSDASLGAFSSVKFNHKPAQTSSDRITTLTSTSADAYALTLQDKDGGAKGDVFVFTGQKQIPKKQYVLLFDPASQKATLEPLSSTYTFNLTKKNRADVSSTYAKIYPRKPKDEPAPAPVETDDLFDVGAKGDDLSQDPEVDNPFDFRHFLGKGKDKRGDESPFPMPNSPDSRAGTGSAANTPLVVARKPAAAVSSKPKPQPVPRPRKRRSPEAEPFMTKKAPAKKPQATPTVRVERRASTHPKAEATAPSKPGRKTATKAAAPASKFKSAEIVHSSDESDDDAEGEVVSSPPAPAPLRRSPEPVHHQPSDHDEDDEDEDDEGGFGGGGLEIEVPDERPAKPRHNALKSLGLGQNLGLGGLGYLKSPSNGPMSLASVANSAEGSPNPRFTPSKPGRHDHVDDDVIDFGTMDGLRGHDSDEEEEDEEAVYEEDAEEVDDRDVEPMDIGPPAQHQNNAPPSPTRKMSVSGLVVDDEDDDPFTKQMMMGFVGGGDSSEESEEE